LTAKRKSSRARKFRRRSTSIVSRNPTRISTRDKFLFLNGWYIRNLPRETIVERVRPFLDRAGLAAPGRDDAWYAYVIGLEVERCRLLSEFVEALQYFFEAPKTYEAAGVKKLMKESVDAQLEGVRAKLAEVADWTVESTEGVVKAYAEAAGLGLGKVAQPIRLAVSGRRDGDAGIVRGANRART
jgi:glutamyl-tRNA synthetase